MLWNFLLSFVFTVLNFFISFFPAVDPNIMSQITNGSSAFSNLVSSVDWIFPAPTFFTMLSAIFTIEGIMLTIKIVRWLVSNVSLGFLK